jgi:sugar lactone lactonase YvrE
MAPAITVQGCGRSALVARRDGSARRRLERSGSRRLGDFRGLGVAATLAMVAVVTVGLASASASAATTGVTAAGGHGAGSAANQLYFPRGLVLDRSGNLYVADSQNSRVQRWAPGATNGVTVAGGSYGSGADELNTPMGVGVDDAGNVYVLDTNNSRVQRWAPDATDGVTVAGGNGPGSAANQLNYPYGLAVDGSGDVYVSDTFNSRVQLWAPGATSGVTVAGGNGIGAGANQLSYPGPMAIGGPGDLYISDIGNRRVQRWAPGASSGVTVAGGNGVGHAANQISYPAGVAVDAASNVYISDSDNYRVQLWAPGATSGVTVAGGNGPGSAANQFGSSSPDGLALDPSGNIYAADVLNARVQRWPTVTRVVIPGSGLVAAPSSGTADLHLSVSLNAASLTPVTVAWNTLNVPNAPTSPILGPQAPPSDYTASSGVVTFAPGQATAQVTIPVTGDSTGADYEYVVVSFHDPTGANIGGFWGLGFGVIESAAHAALPTVLPGTATVAAPAQGTVALDLPVTLDKPSPTPVTVQWNTLYAPGAPDLNIDGSFFPIPQAPPSDYTAVSGVVTFGPGQTTAHVTIPVTSDSTGDSEYFLVSFHDPTGAKMGGSWGLGFGVITPTP